MILDVIIDEAKKVLTLFKYIQNDDQSFQIEDQDNCNYPPLFIKITLKDTALTIWTRRTADAAYGEEWHTDITKPDSITTFIDRLNQLGLALLPEYSCSDPTGQRIGKMWKCNLTAYAPTKQPPRWVVCEYQEHPDPTLLKIARTPIYQSC